MPTTPVRAFVSYAHADSHVQEGFATRLAAAQQQGAFESWADAKIDPGASWDAVIVAELHKADIALLPPDRLKNNLEPYVEQHRTVPAHFFPAFAQTFVATLEARPGPPLPLFILDAVRSVLDRAALHLNPATAGRDVEEAI